MRHLFSKSVSTPVQDVALLATRLVLGAVLIAHGWQKLVDDGLAATADGFAVMGIPLAGAAALFAVVVEVGGGILLVLGAFTPVVGILVTLNMIGAGVFAGHFASGVFASDGGWELVGVIAVAALVLAASGPGRFSVDHAVTSLRRPVPAPVG